MARQYKYNGKELNEELGLNWCDYRARNYQADLGRWFNVDPLAEKMQEWSPYSYAFSNPIYYIDTDGRQPSGPGDGCGKVIAVFYHGGPTGGGKTTTAANAGGTGRIYNSTQSYTSETGRDFIGRVIAPGVTSASGVKNGLGFINDNYQKGDQVVIYGYSYGTDVAVDLSTKLQEVGIPVDLLVTVDGSDGPLQNSTVNTSIPENVNTNINIYQTDDSGTSSSSRSTGATSSNSSSGSSSSDSGTSNFPGSNGGPNTAVNPNVTNVINRNVSAPGTTHGNIQTKQQEAIQSVIKERIQDY